MRLTINLATRRYINMRRLDAGLAVCFLVLGALLVFKVREAAYNQAELGRIAKLNAGADRRPGAAPVSEVKLQALGARIRFANTLIEKKSMNWLNLLDSLEEVVPTGVVLTQIEPSPRDKQLKITGLAHSFANLRQLLENMEQSKNLSEVYLLNQSEVTVGLTQHGLSFAVTCKVSYR